LVMGTILLLCFEYAVKSFFETDVTPYQGPKTVVSFYMQTETNPVPETMWVLQHKKPDNVQNIISI
jgi:hypothetical protein